MHGPSDSRTGLANPHLGGQARRKTYLGSLSADKLDEMTQTKEWHHLGFTREVFAQRAELESFGSLATGAAGGESSQPTCRAS